MKTLLQIALLTLYTTVSAQNFLRSFGSINNDEALAIGMDDDGRVYTTGYFNSNMEFGSNNIITNGLSDLFVARNSSVGGTQWIFSGGSSGPDRGFDIATAPDGTNVITGYYSHNAQFGNITLPSNALSQDFFVLKLNNAGEVIWAKGFGGELGDIGYAVDIDLNGDILVTGKFRGTIDFDGITFTSTPINGGELSYDTFILKMDADGNVLWAKQGQNPYESSGLDIKTDGLGNVIVCGQFSDTLTFDETHNNDIFNAAFVIQFDANGNEQWFRRFTSSQTIAYALEINSDNEIYVTGDNIGPMLFYTEDGSTYFPNDYTYNLFLAKFSNSGDLLWLENNGSENPVSSKDIALDEQESPYITGTFNCRFDEYSEEYGTGIFYSAGWRDVYISKFNPEGERQWSRHMASNKDSYCSAITLKDVDMPIISGGFSNNFVVTSANTFQSYDSNEGASINSSLCGDNNYGNVIYEESAGNKDIFLTAPINLSREPLDYFFRSSGICDRPYRPVCVEGCADSLIHCGPTSAQFDSFTFDILEPEYDLTWESPDLWLAPELQVPQTATFYWTYERLDGCESYADTLHAVIHPIPIPTISDDVVVNDFSPPNAIDLEICFPDSILLMGSQFDSTDTYWWSSNTPYISTGVDSAIYVNQTGEYTFHVENEFGCQLTNDIEVEVFHPIDTLEAFIGFPAYDEPVDTIFICADNAFEAQLYPTDSLGSGIDSILANADVTWTIDPGPALINQGSDPIDALYKLLYSGFYNIIVEIEGICDSTIIIVEREVYVVVYPEPNINIWIYGDNYICPGDTTLMVANGYENYDWGNGNYIQLSNDSILAWEEGTYSVNASVIDEFGCSDYSNDYFYLSYRDAPVVTMSPQSGIVCPGDSVFLTTESAVAHIWVGPSGQIIGTGQSIWVDIPGFYHCIVTDFDSCIIESNFVEVKEYASPYLVMSPGNDLCFSGSIEIEAITDPSATVVWAPPINSSNHSVTVFEPGEYTATVTLCGISTTQSVTVYETSVNANVTINDPPTVCNGDSVLLIGNTGMYAYEWSPGGESTPNLWVTEPGIYTLHTYDSQGCEGISQPLEITGEPIVNLNIPPTLFICPEDTVQLSVDGNFIEYNWSPSGETTPSIWITEPGSYQVEVIDQNGCTGISELVSLEPGAGPPLPETEDLIHCFADDLTVDLSADGAVYWLSDGTPFEADPLILESLESDTVLYYFVMGENGCTSALDSIFVQVIPDSYDPIIIGDTSVCTGDSIWLSTPYMDFSDYSWSINGSEFSDEADFGMMTDGTMSSPLIVNLTVELANCAVGEQSVEINLLPLPQPLSISGNPNPCEGNAAVLYTSAPDSIEFFWNWQNNQSQDDSIEVMPPSTDSLLISLTTILNGCSSGPIETWINERPFPEFEEIVSNSPVCVGELLTISASTTDSAEIEMITPQGYSVSTNQLNFFPADTTDSGLYAIVASTPYCQTIDSVFAEVNPIPQIDLGNDSTYCEGNPASFEIIDYDLVFWQDSIMSPSYETSDEQMVKVEVINQFGCAAKDSVLVFFEECDGLLSNIFTPNGDGVNDYFYFNPYGYDRLRVIIYNRWGKVVCELQNIDYWDGIHCKTGIPVSHGTYFYIVEYATRESVPGNKKGYIQVFR